MKIALSFMLCIVAGISAVKANYGYTRTYKHFCAPVLGKNRLTATTLSGAKEECSKNPTCHMFFAYPSGEDFYYCEKTGSIRESTQSFNLYIFKACNCGHRQSCHDGVCYQNFDPNGSIEHYDPPTNPYDVVYVKKYVGWNLLRSNDFICHQTIIYKRAIQEKIWIKFKKLNEPCKKKYELKSKNWFVWTIYIPCIFYNTLNYRTIHKT